MGGNFFKSVLNFLMIAVASFSAVSCTGDKQLRGEPKIESVELFLLNVDVKRHFSFGNWNSRQHVVARFKAADFEGWGEGIFATNRADFDLEAAARDFKIFIGKTPSQSLQMLTQNRNLIKWHPSEVANMALWDILGQVRSVPSVKLLGLEKTAPVNGMFCILENEPSRVAERAEIAKRARLTNFIKLKIFGNPELDRRLISTPRASMGDKCFIVADANCGYKNFKSLDELAATLKTLSDAGLNALEDPAPLDDASLIELQTKCARFNLWLIPDVNMRPSWKALQTAKKGMGGFYNLHPGCMVDLFDMARLAKKIDGWNSRIMIGDDSLVAAACTIYQQIAIGCGAAWVEALEKPDECSKFSDCVISLATYRTPEGLYAMRDDFCGWGIKMDVEKLRKTATKTAVVK